MKTKAQILAEFSLFSMPAGGIGNWLTEKTDADVFERLGRIDEEPLSAVQLNQLLVLGHEAPTLRPELRQLQTFARDDLQRLARLVVRDLVEFRQLFGDDDDRDDQRDEERADHESADPCDGDPLFPGRLLEHGSGRGGGKAGKTLTLSDGGIRPVSRRDPRPSGVKSIVRRTQGMRRRPLRPRVAP